MEEEPDGAEEAAHALVAQPFAFEVRGGLPTVHTSASVEGEQWKQRWQQCMRDIQRGDAMCVEAMQATRTFGGDAYHLLHVNYEDIQTHSHMYLTLGLLLAGLYILDCA